MFISSSIDYVIKDSYTMFEVVIQVVIIINKEGKYMKIAIIGSGAMGSLYGGRLSRENEVYLIDVWQQHIDTINERGLTTIEPDGTEFVDRPHGYYNSENLPTMDLVMIFVKSIHTKASILQSQNIIGPETLVLTLQNGFGNDRDLMAAAKPENVVIGTTSHGCTLKGPGVIFHAGSGITTIGSATGDPEKAQRAAEILRSGGFEVAVSPDIQRIIFHKLFVNVGINPLTAIFDEPNGRIAEEPALKECSRILIHEAVKIAGAAGLAFDEEAVFRDVLDVARATQGNVSSMRADVLNGRRTEIDKINGAFVTLAREQGGEAPANELITSMIRYLEAKPKTRP